MRNIPKPNTQDHQRKADFYKFSAFASVVTKKKHRKLSRILLGTSVFLVVLLFLPWTQNIESHGYVTTLKPDQRPQTIQSPIPGQIEKWYVKEGDFVQKGDTILRINEVKSTYFDPQLLERTGDQISFKSGSVVAYQEKIAAMQRQLHALKREKSLKLEQTRNKRKQANLKIVSDSITLSAARINLSIAKKQFDRVKALYKEGLKSRLDYETKQSKFQETQAKVVDYENKLLNSKNNLLNAVMEINRVVASYDNKISKIESEVSSTKSLRYESETQVSKLENSLSNYKIRKGLYYVRAPQNGYINKALVSGVGESFKKGQQLVQMMPSDIEIAVETYVRPIDLPLIKVGDHMQVQFDGWPAIVFSGWPNASYGTFGARVVAIQNFISKNGKYRILLEPELTDNQPWPKALRIGSGAQTLALLEDVPIWFEIWRKLNGFPPNYYQGPSSEKNKEKSKKNV